MAFSVFKISVMISKYDDGNDMKVSFQMFLGATEITFFSKYLIAGMYRIIPNIVLCMT